MFRQDFLKAVFDNNAYKILAPMLLKFSMALFLLFVLVKGSNAFEPLVYMRPNETPVFTELYQRYGLLNPPALHVYDSAVYLGQPGEKGPLVIPSSDAFFKDVDQTLRAYHARLGNQELFLDPIETKYVFCPSNGSLQIIFGLVYAIAMSEPQKHFLFVEKIPFYSFHEHAISYRPYPNARFQGFNDPSEIKLNPDETLANFASHILKRTLSLLILSSLHLPMEAMVQGILKTTLLGSLKQGAKVSMCLLSILCLRLLVDQAIDLVIPGSLCMTPMLPVFFTISFLTFGN
jgi:hypothetical protein